MSRASAHISYTSVVLYIVDQLYDTVVTQICSLAWHTDDYLLRVETPLSSMQTVCSGLSGIILSWLNYECEF